MSDFNATLVGKRGNSRPTAASKRSRSLLLRIIRDASILIVIPWLKTQRIPRVDEPSRNEHFAICICHGIEPRGG